MQFESTRARKITGNWKMHKTLAEAKAFVASLAFVAVNNPVQIGLAVPFTMIAAVAEAARGSLINIGAQNMHWEEEGAFTGETSCKMLKDAGASFALIGHSERRQLFHESDLLVNKKLKAALNNQFQATVCIGETLEERQKGRTEEVLKRQLLEGLQGISPDQFSLITLAYEPVWAIGTGQTATPEMAQEAHRFCRSIVVEQWGNEAGKHLVIQYGGSVKAENASALLEQSDIDGFLVGGASLSVDSFIRIIQCQQIKV
jgi:triosephosphate isomerase